MNREIRNLIHKKQEGIKIKNGIPRASDLKEGVMELRITKEGVVLYVLINKVVYKNNFIKTTELDGIEIIF